MNKIEITETFFKDMHLYHNERNGRNIFFVFFSTLIYEIILFRSFSTDIFGFGKDFYLSPLAWKWVYILAAISGLLLAYAQFKVNTCKKMIFKIHGLKI
jgi:hypothetical protein